VREPNPTDRPHDVTAGSRVRDASPSGQPWHGEMLRALGTRPAANRRNAPVPRLLTALRSGSATAAGDGKGHQGGDRVWRSSFIAAHSPSQGRASSVRGASALANQRPTPEPHCLAPRKRKYVRVDWFGIVLSVTPRGFQASLVHPRRGPDGRAPLGRAPDGERHREPATKKRKIHEGVYMRISNVGLIREKKSRSSATAARARDARST